LRTLAKKIDAGKRLPEADYQLDFPCPVELLAELPPKRLGRNYSNVHGDIQRLLALGLVEKNAAVLHKRRAPHTRAI